MKSIFELCTPRDDILKGELREEIFAARLRDVIEEKADPIYGDVNIFFDNTYPTEGIKSLLLESLGRLTGSNPGNNALIRLETSFGGGKTHGLIALYHLATGNIPTRKTIKWLGDDVVFPGHEDVRVAGVVGSDLDASIGQHHEGDGIRTKTLWGEIAYQLGGAEGYEIAREQDELFAAPGTALFEQLDDLLGHKPTLIMVDELARYLRVALAYPTKTGKSNLAEQTVAFLMALIEYAASQPDVVIVITLAGDTDAFSEETQELQARLAESKAVSARQERVIRPSDEGEMPAIVVHRLFKDVDRNAAAAVIKRYSAFYRALFDQNADLPERAGRAAYSGEFIISYPFHPDFLQALENKVSTIPNFQRTRGALRLLALVVRKLWEEKPKACFAIHTHHMDLTIEDVVEELTSRLGRPRFKQVVQADIVSEQEGSRAHAQEIDDNYPSPYAKRLCTTIFLHSLSQGIATGLTATDLYLSVLTPSADGGDDPAVLKRALERLDDVAWFLEYDGLNYRFKTEPSLNKIIADEAVNVATTKAKKEIERRIRNIWRKGFLEPVFFPSTPVEIDDDARLPKLAIMHFDAVAIEAGDAQPPELVMRIYQRKGTDESFRLYQNNVVFLVADKDLVKTMVQQSRRYLAIKRILEPDRASSFNKEQLKKLKKMGDAAELDVRVAITRAYKTLYYPSSDAPKKHAYLQKETLPAQDQGEINQDQTNVVLRVLRAMNKVLTADDQPLSAKFVHSKAWDVNQKSMTTEDLRKAFARKVGLRMLLDIAQLRKTIANGVKNGIWVYYNATEEFAYDKESPPPAYRIGEETLLYDPPEAERLSLRVKGKWQPPTVVDPDRETTCPICGKRQSECTCGVGPEVKPKKLTATGVPKQAFQSLLDQCQEHDIAAIAKMFLTVEGAGIATANDLRTLALAVPQLGSGRFGMDLRLTLTFDETGEREDFELVYRGGWDRYKRIRSLVDPFSKEAQSSSVRARLAAMYDPALEVESEAYQAYPEVLSQLEIGQIQIEVMCADESEDEA